jgi:hypothetical protein
MPASIDLYLFKLHFKEAYGHAKWADCDGDGRKSVGVRWDGMSVCDLEENSSRMLHA